MRLRLYHHHDGARIAYRESGTGPALVLLHSLGLSHREWEPVVAPLSERFRVVLPDLPLHGDSEDRPRHPYSPDWLADVIVTLQAPPGPSVIDVEEVAPVVQKIEAGEGMMALMIRGACPLLDTVSTWLVWPEKPRLL